MIAVAAPMFADLALARLIEGVEVGLCASVAEGVAATQPDARAFVAPLAGGVAAFAGRGSPTNKAVGVGLDRPLDLDELSALEAQWRERGEPMRIELATLALPDVGQALTARGYRLIGFENVLGLSLGPEAGAPASPEIGLEPLAPGDVQTWQDVAIEGFAVPDDGPPPIESYSREALEEVFRAMAGAAGLQRYLARIGGVPAGAASLRTEAPVAQLCGAATLPAFRRRGVQTALLQRRLLDAVRQGCTLATVTTQPGSKSQANAHRRGFQLLYARALLVRTWD